MSCTPLHNHTLYFTGCCATVQVAHIHLDLDALKLSWTAADVKRTCLHPVLSHILSLHDFSIPCCMQVVCTGKEGRLLDCIFPENFDDGESEDYYYYYYNENWPAPTHAAPAPAPRETAPPPSNGINSGRCDDDERARLAVICRSFEITGMLHRRCVPGDAHPGRSYASNLSCKSAVWCSEVWLPCG